MGATREQRKIKGLEKALTALAEQVRLYEIQQNKMKDLLKSQGEVISAFNRHEQSKAAYLDYLAKKYGKDRVSQTSYGEITAGLEYFRAGCEHEKNGSNTEKGKVLISAKDGGDHVQA